MSDEAQVQTQAVAGEEGLRAEQFFSAGYRPADDRTAEYVHELAVKLVGRRAETPANGDKYRACLSDYLAMIKKVPSGLIAWQTGSFNYTTSAYSRTVAETLRDALIEKEFLREVQKPSRGVCRVYKARELQALDDLSFKRAYSSGVLKVRGPSTFENGRRKKGKLIPIKKFKNSTVAPLIQEMENINQLMDQFPLVSPEGTVWNDCYRQFNDGDPTGARWINRGGRVYGGWQSKPEIERLQCTIGGEDICEVDIKACYLFIANQVASKPIDLPEDPYQLIKFVQKDPKLRGLAKVLTSSILSKDGPVKRFPRGREVAGQGRTSLRQQYGLANSVKCKDLVGDIFRAFPFLRPNKKKGLVLMYRESSIVVGSMIDLASKSIPTYPVHDCLLCRTRDEEEVVATIQQEMVKEYGCYATLEVGYKNGDSKVN